MSAKKDPNGSLPLTPDTDTTPSAKITYANEVVAIIAGLAANEVEGIAGMCSISGNILSKNRNVTKGVRVDVHVQGVSFEKENSALQSGAQSAALEAGETEPEKLAQPETVQETEEKPEEEKNAPKSGKQKNSKAKKEKEDGPAEDNQPAEE